MDKSTKVRIGLAVLILVVAVVCLIVWRSEIVGMSAPPRWAIGLLFSLGIGAFTTWAFLTWLRWRLRLGENPLGRQAHGTRPVPLWLTGVRS